MSDNRKRGTGRNRPETEVAFAICAERPEKIARQIARLTGVGPYRLQRRPPRKIHDRYFDLPDRSLARAGLAFRLRRSNRTVLLTLKSDKRFRRPGGVTRRELELPWSRSAVVRVSREIAARGVRLAPGSGLDHSRPVALLKRLGLEMIQNRKNRRVVRNVVRTGEAQPTVLAELAVDSVVFLFPGMRVRFAEVEIESKSKRGGTAVPAIARTLKALFGPELRSWGWGKLATGRLLERLLGTGSRAQLVGPGDYLKPPAYALLAARLGPDIQIK